ncbi:MAG: hypothetical protein HRT71_13825 [Flavobacteriales bacterium]|nr:hypothetical protein [Flavobacteriales bacterium]
MDDAIYNATAGSFGIYDGITESSTNSVTNIIPSSQGFWIHATASPTLTIKESHKTLTTKSFVKNGIFNKSRLKLSVSSDINSFSDEAIVVFIPFASEDANDKSDRRKMNSYESSAPNIFTSSSDDIELTINTIPDDLVHVTIPLTVKVGVSGTYKIDVI